MLTIEDTRRYVRTLFHDMQKAGCVNDTTPLLELVRYLYLIFRGRRQVGLLEAYPDLDVSPPTSSDRDYFLSRLGCDPGEIKTAVDILCARALRERACNRNSFSERHVYRFAYGRDVRFTKSFIYKTYLRFFDDLRIPISGEIPLSPDDPEPKQEDLCRLCHGLAFGAVRLGSGQFCLDCASDNFHPSIYDPDTITTLRVKRTYPNTFEKYLQGRKVFEKKMEEKLEDER